MDVGLLWFDDSDKTLEKKVEDALEAYCAKPRFEGEMPNVCYVHPSMLPKEKEVVDLEGVRVATASTVTPHHLLVGVEGGEAN